MRLPATTPYSWALNAVAILFSKEELSTSLLFPSKKSSKPGLDPKRVERLLSKLIYMLYNNCMRSILLTGRARRLEGFMYDMLLLLLFYYFDYSVVREEVPRGHLGHEDPPTKDQPEVP